MHALAVQPVCSAGPPTCGVGSDVVVSTQVSMPVAARHLDIRTLIVAAGWRAGYGEADDIPSN